MFVPCIVSLANKILHELSFNIHFYETSLGHVIKVRH